MESSLRDDDGGRVSTTLRDAPQDHSSRVVRGGEDVSAPADPRRVAEFAAFEIWSGDGGGSSTMEVEITEPAVGVREENARVFAARTGRDGDEGGSADDRLGIDAVSVRAVVRAAAQRYVGDDA